MLIAGVIALCVLLLVLGFLAPRLSSHPQRGVTAAFGGAGRAMSKAPGALGRLLAKPFHGSNRAVNRSAAKGRAARGKLPL